MRFFTCSVVLIAIAAVIGLYMAVNHFRGRTPPKAVHAVLHGALAVGGAVLALLGAHDLGYPALPSWALGFFAVAAAGGLFLAGQHMSQVRLSSGVVAIHAFVAVTGFLILLAAVYLMS